MKLALEIPWDKIEDIIKSLEKIENIEKVIIEEKNVAEKGILDRKAKNQLELFDIVINIVLSKASEEVYQFTKTKVIKYLKKRNIKIKKLLNVPLLLIKLKNLSL